MSGPDREEAAGPVVPQPPSFQNCLRFVSGWVSDGDNGPCGPNNRISATGQNGSGVSIAFSVSDNNVLDWAFVFFRGVFDAPHWNRRTNLALVCCLDGN
jgi:hypothetical protein